MGTFKNKNRSRSVLISAAFGLLMFGGFALAGGMGVVPGSGIVRADQGDGPTITRITVPAPDGRSCEGDVYLDRGFSGTLTLQLYFAPGDLEPGFGGRSGPDCRDSGIRTPVTFDGQSQAHYSFPSCSPAGNVKSYRVEVDEASLPSGMSPRMAYREDDSYRKCERDNDNEDNKHDKNCTTTVTATKTITTTKLLTTTATVTETITRILTTTVTKTVTKILTSTVTKTLTKIITTTVTKTVTAGTTTTTKTTTTSSTYTTPNNGVGSFIPGGADVDRRGLLAALFSSL